MKDQVPPPERPRPKPEQEMDWQQHTWFARQYYDKLTDDFKEWWLRASVPANTYKTDVERDQYWHACANALVGWLAAKESTETSDERPAPTPNPKASLYAGADKVKELEKRISWLEKNQQIQAQTVQFGMSQKDEMIFQVLLAMINSSKFDETTSDLVMIGIAKEFVEDFLKETNNVEIK